MKTKFTILFIVLVLLISGQSVFSNGFDSLIVAKEVLFKGEVPDGVFFKPGRILDESTIWFCGNVEGLFAKEVYGFRSIDGGANFTHNETPMPGRAAQMDAFDANTAVLATAEGFIYRTTDGGQKWTEVYTYKISGSVDGWFDGCRVLNDSVAVAYGDFEPNGNMHFVRSEDKGATWAEIKGIDYLGAAYGYYTWGTAACNIGESIWCSATNTAYDSSFVFRSFDAGMTWDSYKIPAEVIPNYPRSIAFSDKDKGLIAARGGYLIKSEDGGANWSSTPNPDTLASCYPNSVVAIPNTNFILAMDDIGVYYTDNLGEVWGKIDTPAETESDLVVSGTFFSATMGYVFTENGLVLRFKNQVTDVFNPFANHTPGEFRLNQNYPNPFNPRTVISWQLAKAGNVELTVYNILGAKVANLVHRQMNPGNHSYEFNGSNLTSGVYYYQLVTAEFMDVKKMILIK